MESARAWGRARACKIEQPINELVRSNTSALLVAEGEGEPTEYVLVLADIIKANDQENKSKDYYRSARHKYEKGKLDKYKSACLCNLENPTNELVHVLELCAMVSDITLH